MTPYDGPERRSSDARLAVLEAQVSDLRGSQVSIHKRITDFKQEVKEDLRQGFNSVRDAIAAVGAETVRCERERDKKIDEQIHIHAEDTSKRIKILEDWRNWLTGAYVAGAALVSAWIGTQGKGFK